jgi:hypothetical protein
MTGGMATANSNNQADCRPSVFIGALVDEEYSHPAIEGPAARPNACLGQLNPYQISILYDYK